MSVVLQTEWKLAKERTDTLGTRPRLTWQTVVIMEGWAVYICGQRTP